MASENRQPREKFTALLMRMCQRLDACASFKIRDRDRYVRWAIEAKGLDPAAACEQVLITRMWVVGSYARGMLVPHAWAYLRAQHRETDEFTAHAGAGLTLAGVHFQFGRPFAPWPLTSLGAALTGCWRSPAARSIR